jgi:hypothetical protein
VGATRREASGWPRSTATPGGRWSTSWATSSAAWPSGAACGRPRGSGPAR